MQKKDWVFPVTKFSKENPLFHCKHEPRLPRRKEDPVPCAFTSIQNVNVDNNECKATVHVQATCDPNSNTSLITVGGVNPEQANKKKLLFFLTDLLFLYFFECILGGWLGCWLGRWFCRRKPTGAYWLQIDAYFALIASVSGFSAISFISHSPSTVLLILHINLSSASS